MNRADWKSAVVNVGDARGFLIENPPWPHRIVTAAHCLPHLPPPHPASYEQDRTYREVIGPLDERPMLWASCVFVDPIADVAVLEMPDGQVLCDEADAYEQFVEGRSAFRVGAIARRSRAFVLTLDGRWQECSVDAGGHGRTLTIEDFITVGGMSGSPIVAETGEAIGIVNVGSVKNGVDQEHQPGQAALVGVLPGWLLSAYFQSLEPINMMHQRFEEYLRESYEAAIRARKGGA